MAETLVFSGMVEWSGENPGISLKEAPDGPFTSLASFFRVVLSPHGRGHALVLMLSPGDAAPSAAAPNVCLTDNEPLARWLVSDYVSHFGAWRGLPGAAAGPAVSRPGHVTSEGDAITRYAETVRAGEMEVRLEWTGLGSPSASRLARRAVRNRPTPHAKPLASAAMRPHRRERPATAGRAEPARDRRHRISTAMLAFLGNLDTRVTARWGQRT
jgi:hypothetical protein